MSAADDIRRLADELRVVSAEGMHWNQDDPYILGRFEHVRRVATELFAVVDERDADEIERTVFHELSHLAPIPVVDAAVFDDERRLLLIQRADNQLWAMPGGAIDMGEIPADAAAREVAEETGLVVEATELVGVWDSTRCGSIGALQLYMFVFLCRVTGSCVATHALEVLDQGWFARDELPPLSPGHNTRVPTVFAYLDDRVPYFDR
jgi:ADP-ribose pyrophosphatase YjhB (NUDIX family)